ncbi:hypothetical protein NPIL_327081 [Nephila pilipes]|uniref:Uncharacterized protein n=1 Tax=Nephila pilipes TaxID=299642 RepID=A0A8X6NG99_NEPPI|nr:hypothetical protein NPIL_327081 [Nephila pilipes]
MASNKIKNMETKSIEVDGQQFHPPHSHSSSCHIRCDTFAIISTGRMTGSPRQVDTGRSRSVPVNVTLLTDRTADSHKVGTLS